MRARYFLPYRAALEGEYRFFTDTWDIEGHTVSLSYIHPWKDFTFTGKFRYHDQTGAHFYRDLFPGRRLRISADETRSSARSRVTRSSCRRAYEFLSDDGNDTWGFIKRAKVTASLNMLNVDYHEFSDLTAQEVIGSEPLYQLDADIFQIYFSFFY